MGSGSSSPAIENERAAVGSAHQAGARVYSLNIAHADSFYRSGFYY